MEANEKMIASAKAVLTSCMGVKDGETLLIVTDDGKIDLAHQFAAAGRELGIATQLVEFTAQQGGEPPALVAGALLAADVALLITSGSLSHTKARADANQKGVRIASMPMLTEAVVRDVMDADYDKIEAITNQLTALLEPASVIRVTTRAGTDVTLYGEGRHSLADTGKLLEKGAFGNLPAGEAMVAPLEGKGDGVLVVDGVIAGYKVLDTSLTIRMKDGVITGVEGADAADFVKWKSAFDDSADRIAEFGIGTNEKAVIMGNPLVDEKVFGTIHIAFGNNLFMGGAQPGNIHYDCILNNPTVTLDGKVILQDGKHVY